MTSRPTISEIRADASYRRCTPNHFFNPDSRLSTLILPKVPSASAAAIRRRHIGAKDGAGTKTTHVHIARHSSQTYVAKMTRQTEQAFWP
jgi:hypothetical protein